MTDTALRENLFLKNVPNEVTLHKDFSQHAQDPVANAILAHYHYTSKAALLSTGDGDCLFNSFSAVLVGDESKSIELRFRCCIEMIVNKKKILRHRLYHKMELISPDYDDDCLNCATPGSYSSVFMLIALSNLLNIPVESIYPTVNGSNNIYFRTLNNIFKPPFSDPEIETIIANCLQCRKNHIEMLFCVNVPCYVIDFIIRVKVCIFMPFQIIFHIQ